MPTPSFDRGTEFFVRTGLGMAKVKIVSVDTDGSLLVDVVWQSPSSTVLHGRRWQPGELRKLVVHPGKV